MQADRIHLIGLNHKTAPVEIREKMALSGDQALPYRELKELGCEECCILSTCNRVEITFVARDADKTAPAVRKFLFGGSDLSQEEYEKYSYLHRGQEAVTHMFRVASSLDSMIVGEPQILGQLKQAFKTAVEHGATGPILNRFLHKAFSVAKRVRTETNIGGSAVSISYAAVELAKKIFGELAGKRVMLLGAGEMAELAAEHLITQGIAEVVVVNRTVERAMNLARRFKGRAAGLDELTDRLAEADILISSTGAPGLVLEADQVRPIMRQRMNSPLFLIDIAVPRDLDPAINDIDNVYLYDIDDLQHVVDMNKSERDREAKRGEAIVREESLKFTSWLDAMEIGPTIAALRAKADEICRAELGRSLKKLSGLSDKERKSLEKMASAIAAKMLHDPIMFLKNETDPGLRTEKLAVIRRVFAIDPPNEGGRCERNDQ